MKKLLQLFGFYEDDYEEYEEDYSEYEEERRSDSAKIARKTPPAKKSEQRGKPVTPKLIFFQGIPSENIKLKLRDLLLEGAMVLLDIHELEEDRSEEGRNFINFMRGVAFAHKGESRNIGSELYVITPHEGMLQCWGEEE